MGQVTAKKKQNSFHFIHIMQHNNALSSHEISEIIIETFSHLMQGVKLETMLS
jgi:hypothetical protein